MAQIKSPTSHTAPQTPLLERTIDDVLPPKLTLQDSLLASELILPPKASVSYRTYSSLSLESIERARRYALSFLPENWENGSSWDCIQNSVLVSVQIGKESMIYVFAFDEFNETSSASYSSRVSPIDLNSLQMPDVIAIGQGSMDLSTVYPCSQSCFNLSEPCSECVNGSIRRKSSFAPRQSLRNVFSRFIDSIRERLLDVFARQSVHLQKRIRRIGKAEFIVEACPNTKGKEKQWSWGSSSEGMSERQTACGYLHIHLSPPTSKKHGRLIVQPQLIACPQLSRFSDSQPPRAGFPITLMPFDTPAYFLSIYKGSESAARSLTSLFKDNFLGLGCGDWDVDDETRSRTQYVIAYVQLENSQGPAKGLTVIWPLSLCLQVTVTSKRRPLDYIPALPTQLQGSPEPAKASISSSFGSSDAIMVNMASRTYSFDHHQSRPEEKNRLDDIAIEVSAYVDSVAREREAQREKMRKGLTRALSQNAMNTGDIFSAGSPPSKTGASVAQDVVALNTTTPQSLNQTFYPSPPQSNAPPEGATSPSSLAMDVDTRPKDAAHSLLNSLPDDPSAFHSILQTGLTLKGSSPPYANEQQDTLAATTNEYDDAFTYLDQGFPMDLDFSFPPHNQRQQNEAPERRPSTMANFNIGIANRGFNNVFTDDDFSFFDQPSHDPVLAPSLPIEPLTPLGAGLTPMSNPPATSGASDIPPVVGDYPTMSPVLWIPQPTPASEPTPGSPAILDSSPIAAPSPVQAAGKGLFDSFVFPKTAKEADVKYSWAGGKFAFGLASPPPETPPSPFLSRSMPSFSMVRSPKTLWKAHYDAATDPRIGIVRAIRGRGVKRRFPTETHRTMSSGLASRKRSLPMAAKEHESWQTGESEIHEARDDSDSSDSDDAEDDGMGVAPSPGTPPGTPPPTYLPLGPSLVLTHFAHSHLLPLSSPLLSSATAAQDSPSAIAAASVPTPVSPGDALEAENKILEQFGRALAKEVVENSCFAREFIDNEDYADSLVRKGSETSLIESSVARFTRGLLDACLGGHGLTFQSFASKECEDPLRFCKKPALVVSKAQSLIHIQLSALRFWQKLGLGPRGIRKDVTAFILYNASEANPHDASYRERTASNWVSELAVAYHNNQFGTMTLGSCQQSNMPGVCALQFQSSLRKTFVSFLNGLHGDANPLVIFVAISSTLIASKSSFLQQLFMTARKSVKLLSETRQAIFHFIPEPLVFQKCTCSPEICLSVYDRVPIPVERIMSRRFFEHGEATRKFFQQFAFTLARPLTLNIEYSRSSKPSLDVLDKGAFLHVGYTTSGRWILSVAVDQRGEAHETGVWLAPEHQVDESEEPGVTTDILMVRKVWDFAVKLAARANVEWRIVFTKFGVMSDKELSAWISHASSALVTTKCLFNVHIALFCASLQSPWVFASEHLARHDVHRTDSMPNPQSSPKPDPVFMDVSSATYIVESEEPFPIPFELRSAILSSPTGSIPEPEAVADKTLCTDLEQKQDDLQTSATLLPRSTMLLVRVPSSSAMSAVSMLHIHFLHAQCHPSSAITIPDDLHEQVARSFYELSVLSTARAKFVVNPILPFHLAALSVIAKALPHATPASNS